MPKAKLVSRTEMYSNTFEGRLACNYNTGQKIIGGIIKMV
jgi:hypothetical protein